MRDLREQRPAPAAQLSGRPLRDGLQLPRRWGGQEARAYLCVAHECVSYYCLGSAAFLFPELDALLDFGGNAAYCTGVHLTIHAVSGTKSEFVRYDAHGRP